MEVSLIMHTSIIKQVAVKREAAVTKEMSKQLNDDKKISRKEKDERILWKKNEVILHSNLIFFLLDTNDTS